MLSKKSNLPSVSLRQRFSSWAACVSLSQRQVSNAADAKNLGTLDTTEVNWAGGIGDHITLLKLTTGRPLHVRDLMLSQKLAPVSPRETVSMWCSLEVQCLFWRLFRVNPYIYSVNPMINSLWNIFCDVTVTVMLLGEKVECVAQWPTDISEDSSVS